MTSHVSSVVRPDGRCLVRPRGTWTARAAADAVELANHLDLPAIAHADAHATAEHAALVEAGFSAWRSEAVVAISVDSALEALRGVEVPTGVVFRSAADVNEDRLRLLDDELRQDVPGTSGWRSTPDEFRAHTFEDPAFDPRTYLVAVGSASDEYLGLVRIWMNPQGPRLGMVGVRREHRRRGLASALIAHAFAAVRSAGAAQVSTKFDIANRGSRAIAERLEARRLGTVIELVYEPHATPPAARPDSKEAPVVR
ncbi:MAG TPA: GNAT family N-acetyltransferase [Gaiellaceae bacterium]|nr:GNAT family N-acetyltransferase [Gaiellaceae bacterium]